MIEGLQFLIGQNNKKKKTLSTQYFINRSFFLFVCRAVVLYQECSNGGQTGS